MDISTMTALVGKRFVWKSYSWAASDLHVSEVIEISPSGKFIKLDNSWYDLDKIVILEILKNEKPTTSPLKEEQ